MTIETQTVPVQIEMLTPSIRWSQGPSRSNADIDSLLVYFTLTTFTGSVPGEATYQTGAGWSVLIKRDEAGPLAAEPPIFDWIGKCLNDFTREWLLTLRGTVEKTRMSMEPTRNT